MINNIGGKLQGLGKFILWGGLVASAIVFIGLQVYLSGMEGMSYYYEAEINQATTISILVFILGPLFSIGTGFFFNGLGTLVNNTMPRRSPVDPMPKPEIQ